MEQICDFLGFVLAGVAGLNYRKSKKRAIAYAVASLAILAVGTFILGVR